MGERAKCVVCGEDQTDLVSLSHIPIMVDLNQFIILFPVCDQHTLKDLKPDQYVFDQIVVEVI